MNDGSAERYAAGRDASGMVEPDDVSFVTIAFFFDGCGMVFCVVNGRTDVDNPL